MTLQQKLDLASLFASFFASRPSFNVFFFIFWTKCRNFMGWFYFRHFCVLFLNLAQIMALFALGFAPGYAPGFALGFVTYFEPSFAPNFAPSLYIYSCCAPFYVHVCLHFYTHVFIHFCILFYIHFCIHFCFFFCIPSCAKFCIKFYILF